jgi:DNA repair exonuclease SbcCD ATPase subunit
MTSQIDPYMAAEALIRRKAANRESLNLSDIADQTGLMLSEVRQIVDRMKAERVAAVRPVPQTQPVPDRLVEARGAAQAYTGSPERSIARAATKAVAAIEALAEVIAADGERAQLRAELAKAEATVAQIKAKIRGPKKTAPAVEADRVPCPTCGKPIKPAGMAVHQHKAHS